MDYGSKAAKARKEYCEGGGPAENELEHRIQQGLNWGIISQQHATTLGHVDTAGVFTLAGVLSGIKLWAIRKTALYGNREMDVDNVEYFVDLIDRDFEGIPIAEDRASSEERTMRMVDEALGRIPDYKGQEDAWFVTLLFPGDILCV